MKRHEQEFNVIYCYRLEKYLYTFWRRTYNLVVFLQIFLSTMVFSGVAGTQWYGAIMASLTIGAFVFRPDSAMANAKAQMSEYSRVRLHMSKMDDKELSDELHRLKPKDSDPLGCFETPAYNRASIECGQVDYVDSLTTFETFLAWLAGDLPKK
ncbi:hypothetical protein VV869_23680 [Photobacterium sp. MCCC 1A19761]|uniref:hypothetical protein n=1 Tax=Photobacterium sp. MCCC 1A19761 TaxID=3115000 RepID=UPI00307EE785